MSQKCPIPLTSFRCTIGQSVDLDASQTFEHLQE